MWKPSINISRRYVAFAPQLEALEQRQVLSGLTSLVGDTPLAAVTTTLLDPSPRNEATSPSQLSPASNLALSSALTIPLSEGSLSLSASILTSSAGKSTSDAPQGRSNLGLQVNVGLAGLLDIRVATDLATGGGTQGPALAVGVTAEASLDANASDGAGQTGASLNLSLTLNSPGGIAAGAGGTSSGTGGSGGGLTLPPNLGGQETNPAPGTITQEMPSSQANPSSVPLFGTGVAAKAIASLSLATPSPSMISPFPTHPPTNPPTAEDESAQLALSLRGMPHSQQEKDAIDESETVSARNQLPGRSPSSQSPASPDAREGGKEHDMPGRNFIIPPLKEPETLDTPDVLPWLFRLPEMLGLNKLQLEAFGPIENLPSRFLENLASIPRGLEQMMERMEAEGISASTWLWLGLAGVAACETVRRQFREDSLPDARREPAGGPAIV